MTAYDPQAEENARQLLDNVHYAADPYEVAVNADAVILVTEWREFRALDMRRIKESMRGGAEGKPVFLDGRNLYEPETLRQIGFNYLGTGRGYQPQPFGGDIDEELYLDSGNVHNAARAVLSAQS